MLGRHRYPSWNPKILCCQGISFIERHRARDDRQMLKRKPRSHAAPPPWRRTRHTPRPTCKRTQLILIPTSGRRPALPKLAWDKGCCADGGRRRWANYPIAKAHIGRSGHGQGFGEIAASGFSAPGEGRNERGQGGGPMLRFGRCRGSSCTACADFRSPTWPLIYRYG